ncbi:hypothetical protein GYO_0419 [Bacillus spizizenii TU-B-10]|uniref:Uncharacterized protein n=1 Tax=Bacillus spizizenii (strain DSM 15029 / JCM 12233 / NBRC 101239 / NRRL B-23049 / TU-B-10) TaxID=1052585 RepID=G4NQQ1_BACS4|nr:hypothetical protein GYO_0419 [Bacillus spizizenii TU-B-10]GEK26719.1 hypothetical protein BSU04nite_31080 [Bacillus spizizenii]
MFYPTPCLRFFVASKDQKIPFQTFLKDLYLITEDCFNKQ